MRDEYDNRLWQFARKDSAQQIDHLLARVMQAFCVLHRITWSAPWAPAPRCGR